MGLQRKRSGQEERKREEDSKWKAQRQEKLMSMFKWRLQPFLAWLLIHEMVEDMGLGSIIESLKCYFYYMGC